MGHYDCKECDASPWEEHSPNCGRAGGMTEKRTHASDMTEDKALVERLRDEDSYYRLQEKHWCIDHEELERQRLAAADLIETQAREIERLNTILSGMNDTDVIARTMAENERLRGAISAALRCTPQAKHGTIIYDCGDPWEILTAALTGTSHDQ